VKASKAKTVAFELKAILMMNSKYQIETSNYLIRNPIKSCFVSTNKLCCFEFIFSKNIGRGKLEYCLMLDTRIISVCGWNKFNFE
jgi:hypothetical protein